MDYTNEIKPLNINNFRDKNFFIGITVLKDGTINFSKASNDFLKISTEKKFLIAQQEEKFLIALGEHKYGVNIRLKIKEVYRSSIGKNFAEILIAHFKLQNQKFKRLYLIDKPIMSGGFIWYELTNIQK